MNATTIKQIAAAQTAHLSEWDYVGVRVQEDAYGVQVGDTMTHESNIWIDGEMTDETLDGVSAVSVKLAKHMNDFESYTGDVAIILGSNRASYGEDETEIIMRAPVVLGIVRP